MVNKKRVSSILILALLITSLFSGFAFAADADVVLAEEIDFEVDAHIQKDGDQTFKGEKGYIQFGTTGDSKRLEKIAVKLEGNVPEDMAIEYMAHVQKDGDTPWTKGPNPVGTDGQSKRLEGVAFKLVDKDGKSYPGYSLEYQVHMQTYGWGISADENDRNNDGKINDNFTKWAADGEYAGTRGESKRIEAVRLRVRKLNPQLTNVEAINSRTVKLTFNNELDKDKITFNNFAIYKGDNVFDSQVIDEYKVDGNVITLILFDGLDPKADSYTLNVKNIVDKNGLVLDSDTKVFKYTKTDPASIEFSATTVAPNDEVKIVIKDKDGKDITRDYDLEKDVVVEIDNRNVIDWKDGKLTALEEGYAVANAILEFGDEKIQTGNTIINVKTAPVNVSNIQYTVAEAGKENWDKQNTTLFEKDSAMKLHVRVLDKDKIEIEDIDIAYRSYNPNILVVNQKGEITPITKGKASVLITVSKGDKKLGNTTAVIEVKENPKADSIKIDKTSVTLIKDSGISQKVKIEILDQYGKVFKEADSLEIGKPDKEKICTVSGGNLENGKATLELSPGTGTGTAKITVKYGNLTQKVITVNNKEASTFAGYKAVIKNDVLDLYQEDEKLKQGPETTDIEIYRVDRDGNYIGKVDIAEDDDNEVIYEIDKKDIVSVEDGTVEAKKVGTANITVRYGKKDEAKPVIGKIQVKVVDSKPRLTKVYQQKNAIAIGAGETIEITSKTLLKGYDQYDKEIDITLSDIQLITSENTDIVSVDDDQNVSAVKAGQTRVIVKINNATYVFTVKVTE